MRGFRTARLVRRVLASVAAILVGAVTLAGCGSPGGLHAVAVFSDVNDLVVGAPVKLADLTVGSVSGISVEGDQARVAMTLDRGDHIPADVSAQLKQTSILGEHYVALVPPAGGGHGLLADGTLIRHTEVIGGIQQFVQSGAEVFGSVSAAQLATLIDNSAQGFGGQSVQIQQLLDDFGTVLGGYASRDGEITNLVNQIDQFSSTLAPSAQQDAQSITNLAQTTSVLAQQSDQFLQLLQSLDSLSQQSSSILSTGLPQTEDQINALSAVAHQLALHQQDLATVLRELPLHNATTSQSTVNDYIQLLDDIIVCGIPGGGGGSSPADTCQPTGG